MKHIITKLWPDQGATRPPAETAAGRWAGLLAASLIGLVAALPLLGGRLAEGADTVLHLFRLAQVDALLKQGILFSRWAPDLAYGFGYPLFNYYAPASYYLAEVWRLFGFSLPASFNLATILLCVTAAAGAYLWAADLTGRSGALVSGAAFAFAPYMMINVLHRGALAEVTALALMPLMFWLLYRAVIFRQRIYRLGAVVLFALLIASHNLTALILAPALIAYLLLLNAGDRPAADGFSRRQLAGRIVADLGLLLLAIGLTAWYWLPALGEQELVQIGRGYLLEDFKYDNNFLSIKELFAGPFFLDVRLINLHFPLSLNWVVLLLAVAGLAGFRAPWIGRIDRLHLAFGAVLALVLGFMMLPASDPIWAALPLIRFLQFPWRFLGLTGLLLALLAGYGLENIRRRLGLRPGATLTLTAFAVLVVIAYAIPWTYTEYLATPAGVSIADSMRYEVSSGALGTTSTGEYLPVHVQELPEANPGGPLPQADKLPAGRLPEGAAITQAEYSPLRYALALSTPIAFTAVFDTFFFEGWEAELDGIRVPAGPSRPGGLLSVDVPSGEHDLVVTFNSTPTRRMGLIITGGAVLLLAAVMWLSGSRPQPRTGGAQAPGRPVGVLIGAVILVLGAYLLLRWFLLDGYAAGHSAYDGSRVAAGRPLQGNFDNRLKLIGWSAVAEIAAGQPFETTLFWRALAPLEANYSAGLFLTDQAGSQLGQSDNQHIGDAPTSRWPLDKYARDRHQVALPPGTPPGLYDLNVAVYHTGLPGERLNVLDASGNPAGQEYHVGQVVVGRPLQPYPAAVLAIPHPVDEPFNPAVRLLGYDLDREEAWAGERVFLDLFWEATAATDEDLSAGLWLTAADGHTIKLLQAPLVPGYPTSQWQPGDRWLDRQPILMPAALDPGRYQLGAGLEVSDIVRLGSLEVMAPTHLMAPPPVQTEGSTAFGRVARLTGFDAPTSFQAGQPLTITLAWQSLGETVEDYRSFVQLIDGERRFVAGSDQVPAAWSRPTTGWISGEYILDAHRFTAPAGLPAGSYTLVTGLYDASSGRRLLTESGQDSLVLRPIVVR